MPESSDNESDPGTYEEQRIKNIAARKAKFDELQLKDFKEAACDKNEAKNISLLYNLPGVPGVAGPSGVARSSAGNGAILKVNCAKIQKKMAGKLE